MSDPTQTLPVDLLPTWLQPLARAAESLDPASLFRYVPPEDDPGRASAVLIAFADSDRGPSLLLTQRSADMRHHANQVAFPGGGVDELDATHIATALREAEEEVGLEPSTVHVFAVLPPVYLPASRFLVTPVLAWWTEAQHLSPVSAAEVAAVALVPIAELTEPDNRFRVVVRGRARTPGFAADGLFVWGFTAVLLDQLLALGGWARPWDESRERPLPSNIVVPPVPGD